MHAEGSVLVDFGDTRVLCTASVTGGVPRLVNLLVANALFVAAERGEEQIGEDTIRDLAEDRRRARVAKGFRARLGHQRIRDAAARHDHAQ